MSAYYNDIDPYVAQWLRNLIAAGYIADGEVDCRDVSEVTASDVRGFTQCHFFAGIGGWPLAMRRAGWRDEVPGWSASCPCPPWSRGRIWHRGTAGTKDHRDVWPAFFRLVEACRPALLVGEQVSGSRAKPWIDRARGDLEGAGYQVKSDTRKASRYGSPQVRERFYFLASVGGARVERLVESRNIGASRPWRWRGKEDLRAIANAPFKQSNRWPEPLVRSGDDGLSARMERLRAYGNAIDPWVGAQFICEANESLSHGLEP